MEVLGIGGNQFRAILRRIGSPHRASKSLRNRAETIELIGVPGGIRTLICAVKEPAQVGSRCIYKARVAPQGLVREHKEQISVYRPCIS
jgi:hypothetical protein